MGLRVVGDFELAFALGLVALEVFGLVAGFFAFAFDVADGLPFVCDVVCNFCFALGSGEVLPLREVVRAVGFLGAIESHFIA